MNTTSSPSMSLLHMEHFGSSLNIVIASYGFWLRASVTLLKVHISSFPFSRSWVRLSELLLSKKFIPVYFIVGILAVLLFRMIGSSWFEVFMSTFLCFTMGVISFVQNFIIGKETK